MAGPGMADVVVRAVHAQWLFTARNMISATRAAPRPLARSASVWKFAKEMWAPHWMTFGGPGLPARRVSGVSLV